MKTFICTLLAICGTVLASDPTATPRPNADELRTSPTVDGYTMLKDSDAFDGKVVKIRFTTRATNVINKDGTYHGQLGVVIQKVRHTIAVEFQEPVHEWFMKIPDHPTTTQFVYARITHGANAVLLGQKIRTGPDGPEFYW